jgi:hypothetical protein
VRHAAIRAVAYADVFGYPLDAEQIGRYLHGVVATHAATTSALEQAIGPGGPLSYRDGFYMLRGREELVAQRRQRAGHAEVLWPVARWYGRLISQLPFVRMVAVTGSLAWDNADADADLDFLVVTEPDRLWVCRWMIAVLTETVRLAGVPLCPNYIISERALALTDRNLYTAYELAQMKPITGYDTYRQMLELNAWVQSFLPNTTAFEPSLEGASPLGARTRAARGATRIVESVLRSQLGATLDRLEMRYRIRKWTGRTPEQAATETAYGPDCYKAHTTAHKAKVLAAFAERLERMGAGATVG